MKVLITGAGGFLGTYFAQHLDHDVDAPNRQDLNLTNSAEVAKQLRSGHYDVILHCASAGRNTAKSMDADIATNNLVGFSNLVANRHEFGMLINFATGAEFDINTDINCVSETEIWSRNPIHSYGRSKNIIARQAQMLTDFYNLRIFGCFDSSESNHRPLKTFINKAKLGQTFSIPADKEFDMISVPDILTVTQAVMAKQISDKDINLVYNTKYKLSDFIIMFAELHNLDTKLVSVGAVDQNCYTGDGSKLSALGLELLGLEKSLKNYQI